MNLEKTLDSVQRELTGLDVCTRRVAEDQAAIHAGIPTGVSALAYDMQALYTGFERAMTHCLKPYGEIPGNSAAWHQDLLARASAESEGRPAVISGKTAELLSDLLRFRHFARSAYPEALNEGKLLALSKTIPVLHEMFAAEVGAFVEAIKASERKPEGTVIPRETAVDKPTGVQDQKERGGN